LPDIGLHGGVFRHGLVTLRAKGPYGRLEGGDIQLQVEQARDRAQQRATHGRIGGIAEVMGRLPPHGARRYAPSLRRLHDEFLRAVNPYGFVSIQRFYIYAEQGLSRQRVSVWIYEGQLRIEYRETLIARYRCAYDQRQKRLCEVSHPMLYHTVFASPQLELLELDDTQWSKVQQRALQRRTPRRSTLGEQLLLAGLEISALLFLYLQVVGTVGRNCFPYMSCVM